MLFWGFRKFCNRLLAAADDLNTANDGQKERSAMMKKALSLLLTLAMVLSLSVSAFAAEEVTPVAQYGTWTTATNLTEGQPVSFTLDTYNGKLTDNQIWFSLTVEEDDQAICLDFEDITKSTTAYIYRASTLEAANPSTNNYERYWSSFNTDSVFQWKAPAAGVYYIMLRPYSSSTVASVAATLTYTLVDGDLNEANDSWKTATELTENVPTYYTLNGQNDVDWFKITTTVPGEAIKLNFSNFNYTVPNIDAYLYSGADLEAGKSSSVWDKTNFSDNMTHNYKANVPGDYYLKIVPYATNTYVNHALKVGYSTVEPDANEINDTYAQATTVDYNNPVDFTLNGSNDVDWFYFETSQPNEVVHLSFSGFETDYSNKINYYVYDAVTGGYSNARYDASNVNMTHSQAMTFANVGGHYIRVSSYFSDSLSIENALTLTLEQGVADGQEPNDTWQQANLLSENVDMSYNIPSATDVDWFKFSTTEADQTVELGIYIPVGGRVDVYLYSYADLMNSGSGAGALNNWSTGAGSSTMRHMLSDVGDYYVRISDYAGKIFEESATISYVLIAPDANERNNGWKTATTMNEGVSAEYNLPAGNDVDYFKFSTTEPNQTVELTSFIPAGGRTNVYLYSYEDLMNKGNSAAALNSWTPASGTNTMRHMLSSVGDYYVQISDYAGMIFDESATITYDLIAPDANERNNGWDTAVTLNEGVATGYNLPAANDADYFKFSTTKPNQTVELTSIIPTGGRINLYLYSHADLVNSGNGAAALNDWTPSSGTNTMRHMLSEAGDYYVKISDYAGKIFDETATISYKLIAPDANERNNGYTAATELAPNTAVSYKISAENDYDYFVLGSMTAGDILEVTFGNVPANSSTMYAYLYRLPEGETSLVSEGDKLVSKGVTSKGTWNIQNDGQYYLRMHAYGWIDQSMWLKYAVTQKDKPVTGISAITNGGSTIFEGKTLQLYANVKPVNATNQNVTWSSTNKAAATIDENGLVTGVAPGKTTITATTVDGQFTAQTTITVEKAVPVTGVTVATLGGNVAQKGKTESDPFFLNLNTSVELTASVVPDTATERAVIWSVSDPEVLSVTDYGKVWAVGSGDAYVTATTVDGGYTANFYVNVPDEDYPVRGISLNYNAATIYMGEEGLDLVSTVSPSYATNPDVVWSSDNETVATVDQNGHVTAVSVGYATITVAAAENHAVTNTCIVSVQPVRTRVTGISFAEKEVNVGIYGNVELLPIITPDNATDKGVTWTTSNKTVATVSRTGVVTALNIGTATITATTDDGSFTAEVTVRVSSDAAMGDINNDGDADAGDALLVLRYSVGLASLSEAQKLVADVNGDGDIDAGDAVLLLRYDAGLIDAFPAEDQ